jgi:hypothetical protein
MAHRKGKGIRGAFDSTEKGKGKQKPAKPIGKGGAVKVPKDTGRKKRKVKTTFNSPKKVSVSYG